MCILIIFYTIFESGLYSYFNFALKEVIESKIVNYIYNFYFKLLLLKIYEF